MANTKHLTREERKAAKRRARKELKKLYANLTKQERRAYKADKAGGIKGFLLGQKKKK